MNPTLIVYYSRTGSNQYLAHRLAQALSCDIESIRPWPGPFFLLIMLSWLGIGAFSRIPTKRLDQYEQIIVCGPIWMGTLVAPLRGILNKLKQGNQKIGFVTCCGSTDEGKDDTFGYATIFPKVEKIVGERLILAEAFPIDLVIPADKKEDDELIMNTRLSDENFKGNQRTARPGSTPISTAC